MAWAEAGTGNRSCLPFDGMLGAVPGAASECSSVTISEKKVTTEFSYIIPQLPPLPILQQWPITKAYCLQILGNYMHIPLSIHLSIRPYDNTIIVFSMSESKLRRISQRYMSSSDWALWKICSISASADSSLNHIPLHKIRVPGQVSLWYQSSTLYMQGTGSHITKF